MSKIKEKKILVLELSKDFFVEAEETDESYYFWICRTDYGVKSLIFGVPVENHEDLRSALCGHMLLFQDIDYMYGYLEPLLEGEDVDDMFNIEGEFA